MYRRYVFERKEIPWNEQKAGAIIFRSDQGGRRFSRPVFLPPFCRTFAGFDFAAESPPFFTAGFFAASPTFGHLSSCTATDGLLLPARSGQILPGLPLVRLHQW
jgi:hypothetical protein